MLSIAKRFAKCAAASPLLGGIVGGTLVAGGIVHAGREAASSIDYQTLIIQQANAACPTESIILEPTAYLEEYNETVHIIGQDAEGNPLVMITTDGKGSNWSILTDNNDGTWCQISGGTQYYQEDFTPSDTSI